VGKASSAKKVAQVAQSARGVKVREPRGKVFPVALAAVLILGTLLVWYSRQSSITVAGIHPTVGEHYHVAFGVYDCDKWLGNVQNNNEAAGTADNEQYKVTGIHTHGDGVIHVHPFGSAGAGKNAKLNTWFNLAGVKITDTSLAMPEGLGSFSTKDKCGDKAATLKALVWDDATSTSEPKKYLTDLKSIRFVKNGMAITLAFTPDDNSVDLNTLKPPSAANLAALGAADGGASTTGSATTVAGASSTTVAEATASTEIPTTVASSTSSSTTG
jgi:hypothetical protein